MPTPRPSNPKSANRVLAALPAAEYERVWPRLERVPLIVKQIVYEQNAPIEYVYFPFDSVVSEIARMENGAITEVTTIGREGMLGLPLFLDTDRTPLAAFVQVAGQAARMEANDFRAEMKRGGPLRKILLRYTQGLLVQIAQSGACNHLHSPQQRCARWLLMTHDRVGRDEFMLTQEFLCQMLGVRRATVSETASALQQDGLIRYSRGRINIVDRGGLEAVSCECYGVICAEHDRVFAQNQADA